MFLRGYRIIGAGQCLADGAQFRVTALFTEDISPLLPYLNAALKYCTYAPAGPTLTLKCKGSPVILHPNRVVVGQLREIDHADDILDALVEFINQVYDRKETINPEFQTKEMPQPQEIYAILPKTNCGDCGDAACLAFAVKLVKGEKRPEDCPHLSASQAGAIYVILEGIDEIGNNIRQLMFFTYKD